jgi:hypothetical protein
MTRSSSSGVVREVVTRQPSLTLSAVAPRPTWWCTAHGVAHEGLDRCLWCGAPADPVAGVYLEQLYPGRTTCRPCGRLQVACSCETVRRSPGAPAHRIPAPRTPVLRDGAPASGTGR